MFYKGWPQVQNNRRAPYCTWDCLFGWANSTSWTRLLKSTPWERLTPEWSGVLQRTLQLPLHGAGALLAKLSPNHHWNLKHRGKNTTLWWGYANEFCSMARNVLSDLSISWSRTILHWTEHLLFLHLTLESLSFFLNDKQPSEVWYLLSIKVANSPLTSVQTSHGLGAFLKLSFSKNTEITHIHTPMHTHIVDSHEWGQTWPQ